MGSYSDADHRLPFVSEEDVKRAREILQLTIDAMRNSGTPYKGVLYGQFMLTANGPYVIEYNARFGDPEAMNVLPIMDTPFSEVIRAGVEGSLDKLDVRFYNKATVCKYLVPEGYPENPVSDSPIKVASFENENIRLYYSSVYEKEGVVYTTRSRAAAVVGIADTLDGAERNAQEAVGLISGRLRYRSDIGTRALVERRVEHMNLLHAR